MKDYGNAIRMLRKKNNLTQQALASKLNISGQAVSKWENNSSQPDLETVIKMTEIFGITMNEFTELCQTEEPVNEAPQTEEAKPDAASETAESAPPLLIGVCSGCGSSIYNEENLGERVPKIVCKSCKEARIKRARAEEDARRRQEAAKRAEVKSSFLRATIIPAVVIGILMIVGIIISLTSGSPDMLSGVFGSILLAVLAYVMVVQICWDTDGIIGNIFFWSVTKSFTMPGLIFSLDLDGIIWYITVKLGLAILAFLLSCAVAVLGTLFSLFIAPFIFPFSLVANIRRVKRGEAI